MDASNVIFLLLFVGGVFSMFFMHRGGHARSGMSGMSGMGCCGGKGHNHDGPPADERPEKDKKPLLGQPGTHSHDHRPAVTGGRSGS